MMTPTLQTMMLAADLKIQMVRTRISIPNYIKKNKLEDHSQLIYIIGQGKKLLVAMKEKER